MPISRHFEIVYLLLNKKKTTAKELAERFEVSTRTIYRDIDTLSAALAVLLMNVKPFIKSCNKNVKAPA